MCGNRGFIWTRRVRFSGLFTFRMARLHILLVFSILPTLPVLLVFCILPILFSILLPVDHMYPGCHPFPFHPGSPLPPPGGHLGYPIFGYKVTMGGKHGTGRGGVAAVPTVSPQRSTTTTEGLSEAGWWLIVERACPSTTLAGGFSQG